MESINETQKKVFEYIKKVISERGLAPSVREIGAAVGRNQHLRCSIILMRLKWQAILKEMPISNEQSV